MFDIDSALRTLVEREGSDLHVKVDSPPVVRMHGELSQLEGHGQLSAEDTEKAFHEIAEAALADRVRGGRRGRLLLRAPGRRPLPRQRLQTARHDLDRLPCDPLRDPLDRRPRPARGRPQPGRGGARDHPRHRHHRLGQVDDAGGDDRPHQRDPGPAHHHARGPDRVPARRQAARSSTSAKSAPTPSASAARCAASCARTPT